MHNHRRVKRVSKVREIDLRRQFDWLADVHVGEVPHGVHTLAVSVFDHWLSRADACALLENVTLDEQKRRDELLTSFCAHMAQNTEVLSFTMRGRNKDRCVFRYFESAVDLANYCQANGGKLLKHRHFHVVLPELGCAFYENWDDTYIFYFVSRAVECKAIEWARKAGVHILK